MQAERSARQAEKDAATRERDAAIAGLTDCTDDVWSLWQQCIDLATKYLPLGAAYAAAVADADAGDPSVFLRKAPPAEAAPTGVNSWPLQNEVPLTRSGPRNHFVRVLQWYFQRFMT